MHRPELYGAAERAGLTYWIATDKRIILLTVFCKTRMRDEREIDRARRALARCIDEAHEAVDEEAGS